MRQFEVQNLPSSFYGYERREPYHLSPGSSDDSTASPSSPASESWDHSSRGGHSTRTRRRRRGGNRGSEKKVHSPISTSPPHDKPMTKNDIYFALDCEMVGVGPEGLDSAVARVTICNWAEKVVLDTFVQVPVEVTDYRTFVSGIEAKDLESDTAMPLEKVQEHVKSILHGKILIGHALENDLAALQITHPWHDVRDSANYPPFMKEIRDSNDSAILRPRKLKELVRDRLGRDIQAQGKAHNPIEDARAALRLYKAERMEWEKLVMKQVAVARENELRESPTSFARHFNSRPYIVTNRGQKGDLYNRPNYHRQSSYTSPLIPSMYRKEYEQYYLPHRSSTSSNVPLIPYP
mmetsp:Transcript_18202/g.37294  ORF Transcript_18202/g.37294 Transcript_18202/m.37294 type:complete len:350 (-) Transcript_18202:193-1242(-)